MSLARCASIIGCLVVYCLWQCWWTWQHKRILDRAAIAHRKMLAEANRHYFEMLDKHRPSGGPSCVDLSGRMR